MGQRVEPRQTRGSSCANNPDGPCAKSALARCPRRCGSAKGSWVYDTIVADWRAYWPADTRVGRSNVDASSSGNQVRKTCCNPGTYVACALGSSRAQTNTTAARIKTKQRRPRRTKKKKQEELSGQEPEEKSREEEGNSRPVLSGNIISPLRQCDPKATPKPPHLKATSMRP